MSFDPVRALAPFPADLPATAEAFPRTFAALWAARDAEGLANLLAEDGTALTLTGAWGEGRRAVAMLFGAELRGAFARSRLVTGKVAIRPVGEDAMLVHQRFVLSGLIDDAGQDMGRIAAMLTAVLIAHNGGWEAVTLQFTALNV